MEVEPVEHALVTFTTGSTGMPKLLLRKHSFLLNQSQALSMAYELVIKKELDLEEEEAVYCTNLPVFPLHFMKVRQSLAGCAGRKREAREGAGSEWSDSFVVCVEVKDKIGSSIHEYSLVE